MKVTSYLKQLSLETLKYIFNVQKKIEVTESRVCGCVFLYFLDIKLL